MLSDEISSILEGATSKLEAKKAIESYALKHAGLVDAPKDKKRYFIAMEALQVLQSSDPQQKFDRMLENYSTDCCPDGAGGGRAIDAEHRLQQAAVDQILELKSL